ISTGHEVPISEAADDNPITTRFHCRGSCCDHHEWCRFWASVGECKSNREWMSDNCQLACGTCRRGRWSGVGFEPKRKANAKVCPRDFHWGMV
ncbi:shTK domain protein, partial [Ancylostoma caninum]